MMSLSFFCRQMKTHWLYFLFFFCGLTLILSVLYTAFNYQTEIARFAQSEEIQKINFEVGLTQNFDLPAAKKSGVTIYMQGQTITYDVELHSDRSSLHISDYQGGIALYTVANALPVPSLEADGDFYTENRDCIWLSEPLASLLECHIGDQICIAGKEDRDYTVKDVYDAVELKKSLGIAPSFLIATDGEEDFSEIKAVSSDFKTFLRFTELLTVGTFTDDFGYVAVCNSFRTVSGIFTVLQIVLSLAWVAFLLSVILIYIRERKDLFHNMYVLGATRRQILFGMILLFGAWSALSSLAALGVGCLFGRMINGWALQILNIVMTNAQYGVAFAAGTPCVLLLTIASIAVFLPKEAQE